MIVFYLFFFLTAPTVAAPQANSQTCNALSNCKPIPGDPAWPSNEDWKTLNNTVSGRLKSVTAPGSVCHADQSNFNNASCTIISQQWLNSSWHANNPWTTDYNDNTCLPNASLPCTTIGYPAYVIEAVNPEDVQAGVRFASNSGVRLVVKGTGHDYPGRSKGSNSLEIWTHLLQGVNFTINDPIAVANGVMVSAKIGAGMQWGSVYKEAAKNNVTIIGGSDPDVGVGGWILNAGHSPISTLYGLGADQILEMEIVTADGEYRIINETTNSDLFWAMRGGGGSTFGVMLSVTVKAYPILAGIQYDFSYNATAGTDTYWSMIAYLLSQLPDLSEAGMMGYFYIQANPDSVDPKQNGSISGTWLFPKRTSEQAKELIDPIEKVMTNSSWSKDSVYIHRKPLKEFTNFMSVWAANTAESTGTDGRLGSWLLNGDALHNDTLKMQLEKLSQQSLIGQFVAGPGVRNAQIPGGSNAVLPAWRMAYVHMDFAVSWTPLNATEKAAATKLLREELNPVLKDLAPNSGAYINECDPSNPDWQHDYYGENYPRLLQIKQEWDPKGVFWCKPCVGHELWDLIDGSSDEDPLEWGIGQSEARICKK